MNRFLSIIFILTALLTVKVDAQNESSPGMGAKAPGVVAKPSFETVEGGLNVKVWLMSVVNDADFQIDTNGINRNTETTDETKPPTHHIMVGIKDAAEGKELTDANVKLEILSPSGKTDEVDLDSMAKQYGANIPLQEQGEYRLNLSVNTQDGRKVDTPFNYRVSR